MTTWTTSLSCVMSEHSVPFRSIQAERDLGWHNDINQVNTYGNDWKCLSTSFFWKSVPKQTPKKRGEGKGNSGKLSPFSLLGTSTWYMMALREKNTMVIIQKLSWSDLDQSWWSLRPVRLLRFGGICSDDVDWFRMISGMALKPSWANH